MKIYWNLPIQVDRELEDKAHKPDIIIFNKTDRHCTIVDVAIPGDHNIEQKQQKKLTNTKILN